MEEIKFNGRAFGKSYQQFCKFIEAIKKKEKPLVVGIDYVCMSRDMYNQLSNSGGGVGYSERASDSGNLASGAVAEELLPCPFCNKKVEIYSSHFQYTIIHQCEVIGVRIGYRANKKEVINIWNKRATVSL